MGGAGARRPSSTRPCTLGTSATRHFFHLRSMANHQVPNHRGSPVPWLHPLGRSGRSPSILNIQGFFTGLHWLTTYQLYFIFDLHETNMLKRRIATWRAMQMQSLLHALCHLAFGKFHRDILRMVNPEAGLSCLSQVTCPTSGPHFVDICLSLPHSGSSPCHK